MCNAFFMDLPVSSFVFHSSLLTVKSINLGLHMMASFVQQEIVRIFIVATLITEVLLKQFWIHTTVYNKLNIAGKEGQWIFQLQMVTGAGGTIHIFHSDYFDYRCTFRTVLDSYCCVTR